MTVPEYLAKRRSPLADISTKAVCVLLPDVWFKGLKRVAAQLGQEKGMQLTVQDVMRYAVAYSYLPRNGGPFPTFKTFKPKRICKLPDGDF